MNIGLHVLTAANPNAKTAILDQLIVHYVHMVTVAVDLPTNVSAMTDLYDPQVWKLNAIS